MDFLTMQEQRSIPTFFLLSIIAIGILFLMNYYILQQQLGIMKSMHDDMKMTVDGEDSYICMRIEKGQQINIPDFVVPSEI